MFSNEKCKIPTGCFVSDIEISTKYSIFSWNVIKLGFLKREFGVEIEKNSEILVI